MDRSDALEANRANWDERTAVHLRHYPVEDFKRGGTSLHSVELKEVGTVESKSLLHLQCHFGLDTLSWARLGARVTGVDFSGAAISAARDLAAEVELHASFIQCDVYEISRQLDEQFDIVYSSYGVLCWLPDLDEWARAAARHVKPGGIFYLADVHPLAHLLDDEGKKPEPGVRYFHDRVPFRSERHGSYVGGTVPFEQPLTYQWQHSLGEIVSAVSDAGLQVEYLHEFPMVPYEAFPGMIQEEGDWFHLPGDTWPLLFSLRAHRA